MLALPARPPPNKPSTNSGQGLTLPPIKLDVTEYNEVLEPVSLLLRFERPAVVVGFLYVFVCIFVVGNPHIPSIPVYSFARSNSDITQ